MGASAKIGRCLFFNFSQKLLFFINLELTNDLADKRLLKTN
jgi:hypothetical protein